jgi:Ca2+-binding RTX toxin-like protein
MGGERSGGCEDGLVRKIDGGRANDRVFGGSGHDTVWGGSHDDIVVGQGGRDGLYGDIGDDFLNAHVSETVPDEYIACGPGSDKAKINRDDPRPIGCERVVVRP